MVPPKRRQSLLQHKLRSPSELPQPNPAVGPRARCSLQTAVLLCGLVAGTIAAQLYGLRLGGVPIVPLVAVHLLRSFGTFPVFVLSTVAAYAPISYIKTRLPL